METTGVWKVADNGPSSRKNLKLRMLDPLHGSGRRGPRTELPGSTTVKDEAVSGGTSYDCCLVVWHLFLSPLSSAAPFPANSSTV